MKICNHDAVNMRDLYLNGATIRKIAKTYGVHKSTVFRVLGARRKVDNFDRDLIKERRPGLKYPGQKLTLDQIEEIKELKKRGVKPVDIAKQFSICESTVSRAYRK